MNNVVQRIQCPNCMDSGQDNLIIYSDGSSYCFACNQGDVRAVNKEYDLHYREIASRGIDKKTCERYEYLIGNYKGKLCHFCKVVKNNGSIGYKIRTHDTKEFFTIGKVSQTDLIGKHLTKPNAQGFIVITEGEIDLLSVAQVLGIKSNVVSLPCGVSSVEKCISFNLEYLLKFQYVVLCFDNDEAGKKATEKAIALLPKDKVKVCNLTEKDANEMLLKGKSQELYRAIWNAENVALDGIVTLKDITIEKVKVGLPWQITELNRYTKGIRTGELIVIAGGSGSGKTLFLMDTLLNLAKTHNKKVGGIFLEQSTAEVKTLLAELILGEKNIERETLEQLNLDINKGIKCIENNLLLYDHRGGLEFNKLLSVIKYMVSCGVKYIFVDNLTSITAMTKENERKEIDNYIQQLISFIIDFDVTIFLASHLTKPSGSTSYEEGARVTGSALRGSQSIQFGAHLVLGVERDKLNSDEQVRNKPVLRVVKNRYTGMDGVTIDLFYDKSTGRIKEFNEFENLFNNEI